MMDTEYETKVRCGDFYVWRNVMCLLLWLSGYGAIGGGEEVDNRRIGFRAEGFGCPPSIRRGEH